jgi:hypothetical protein
MFRRERKPPVLWAKPEESVGRQCEGLGIEGNKCYEAVGSASEAFIELREKLQELLELHKEDLERGIKKCSGIGIGLFMIGSQPSQTTPTIIISSLNKAERKYVKNLFKDEIKSKYPAFQIKTLCECPAILTGNNSAVPLVHSALASSLEGQFREDTEVLNVTRMACGATIRYKDTLATLGGIVSITNDRETCLYAMTTGHSAQLNPLDEHSPNPPSNRHLVFDEDSDDDNLDEEFMDEELMGKGASRVSIANSC